MYSVYIKNASSVDIFWGFGFVVIAGYLFVTAESLSRRQMIISVLVAIWGLRLTIHLFIRNVGKPEDFRYQKFRKDYGEHRYWWFSYFQVFLLQGILMLMIASPLFGVFIAEENTPLNVFDILGIAVWIVGISFEAGGDYQLAKFKSKRRNKDEVLSTGFWKYTRHPNYFGDAAVWWSYALFAIAAQQYWFVAGAILMTYLIIKISGVAMLERSLSTDKPTYKDYVERTSAFFPWFPKKQVQ
jgi:steroid 5-alpha reductase family enzyme